MGVQVVHRPDHGLAESGFHPFPPVQTLIPGIEGIGDHLAAPEHHAQVLDDDAAALHHQVDLEGEEQAAVAADEINRRAVRRGEQGVQGRVLGREVVPAAKHGLRRQRADEELQEVDHVAAAVENSLGVMAGDRLHRSPRALGDGPPQSGHGRVPAAEVVDRQRPPGGLEGLDHAPGCGYVAGQRLFAEHGAYRHVQEALEGLLVGRDGGTDAGHVEGSPAGPAGRQVGKAVGDPPACHEFPPARLVGVHAGGDGKPGMARVGAGMGEDFRALAGLVVTAGHVAAADDEHGEDVRRSGGGHGR